MDGDSMLGQPAGWYRDPAPRDPAAPDTRRFWDGTGWTARTRTASRQERRAWREEAVALRIAHLRELVARAAAGDEEAQRQLTTAPARSARRTTADRQLLAGWWARVVGERRRRLARGRPRLGPRQGETFGS